MTKRSCKASLLIDIHKDSLKFLNGDVAKTRLAAQADFLRTEILGDEARWVAFRKKHFYTPIECVDSDHYPSEALAAAHIDALVTAFNTTTFAKLGLTPPAGLQPDSRVFPAELATDPGRLGANSTLSCLHLVWDDELQEWVLVPNRDLVATVNGAVLSPASKEMSNQGKDNIAASVRIVLEIGPVILP